MSESPVPSRAEMATVKAERDTLRQQLIACEAKTERLREGLILVMPMVKGYAHEQRVGRNWEMITATEQLITEPPPTALAEYWGPVREVLIKLQSGCPLVKCKEGFDEALALLTALGKESHQ